MHLQMLSGEPLMALQRKVEISNLGANEGKLGARSKTSCLGA